MMKTDASVSSSERQFSYRTSGTDTPPHTQILSRAVILCFEILDKVRLRKTELKNAALLHVFEQRFRIWKWLFFFPPSQGATIRARAARNVIRQLWLKFLQLKHIQCMAHSPTLENRTRKKKCLSDTRIKPKRRLCYFLPFFRILH